jgi:Complex I intermediate-associated protein 30 (CIA30)
VNLDDYDALVYRVFGDGRKYIVNLRTENWVVGESSKDIWQAFLFARYTSGPASEGKEFCWVLWKRKY